MLPQALTTEILAIRPAVAVAVAVRQAVADMHREAVAVVITEAVLAAVSDELKTKKELREKSFSSFAFRRDTRARTGDLCNVTAAL